MTDERNPRAAELLRKAFCLSDEQISVVTPDLLNASEMLPKLEYLTEHFPPIDWSGKSASALITRPFFKLTYDEFLFCASLPERLGFTEEEREKYDGMVLYWNCTEDPRILSPLLSELCGEAESIVKSLCFPSPLVGFEDIRRICERLLSYPVRVSPVWFLDHWKALFSAMEDPLLILDELDKRFRPEHVMEVFMSRGDWAMIAYSLRGEGDRQFAEKAFADMDNQFKSYRRS